MNVNWFDGFVNTINDVEVGGSQSSVIHIMNLNAAKCAYINLYKLLHKCGVKIYCVMCILYE